MSWPQAGSLQGLKKIRPRTQRGGGAGGAWMCLPSLAFPSDCQTSAESAWPARRGVPCAPRLAAAGRVVGLVPRMPRGHSSGAAGTDSQVGVLGSQGAVWKGKAGARPRLWVRGTQAKPREGPPASPASNAPEKHFAVGTRPSCAWRAWVVPGRRVRPATQSGWICFSGNPVFSF